MSSIDHAASPADARVAVLQRITEARRAAGRAGDVTLVAVSKQQPWPLIQPLLDAGHRVFGENRVQEAAERWSADRHLQGLELRLLGPLQSNKAAEAVGFFDVIETLDRPKLARALADAAAKQGRSPRLYVQVNTGEEPQKAGVTPDALDALLHQVRSEFGLTVEGLMCIPPADEPPGLHFALLAKLAARNGLDHLSMGMSGDFETAVRFGATSVRVGSLLFGERKARTEATPPL